MHGLEDGVQTDFQFPALVGPARVAGVQAVSSLTLHKMCTKNCPSSPTFRCFPSFEGEEGTA